jgi:predicted cobalt transporter CbtA
MAGEKKEEKNMCESGFHMDKTCGVITGLLVLVAGVLFLLSGIGQLAGATASLASGVLLALVGLSVIVHSMRMCPMCK